MSNDTRKRLNQQAVSTIQLTRSATDSAVQAIVNGADVAAATSAITMPEELPSPGFDTEVEEYEDNGGVLVLYTRPEQTPYRIIYSQTFDIYASWRTDYCALACKWLFAPRKWIADGRDIQDGDTMPGNRAPLDNRNSNVNGVPQGDDMEEIFGEGQASETVKIEDEDERTEWVSPLLKRVPSVGPVQPTYSSTNPSPTFVILYADHRLNLYFSALPSFPSTTSLRSSLNDSASTSPNSAYLKLDVLSCPILTPSVVLYESMENPSASSPKQAPGKTDSSAASSPEQPLLQQQQQQIMQQQQQSNNTPFNQADSMERGTLDSTAADRVTARRNRQILPGQATIFVREEDETMWVGFRSYRPTRVLIPGISTQSIAEPAKRGRSSATGTSVLPELQGTPDARVNLEVLDLLKSVRQRGSQGMPAEVLASMGMMGGGVDVDKMGKSATYANGCVINAAVSQALDAMKTHSSSEDDEGDEEDWIYVLRQGGTSRIVHYKISREDLDVSDAFGLLAPSDKGSKRPDLHSLSRLEWVSKEIDSKTFANTSLALLKNFSGDGATNRTLLRMRSSTGIDTAKIVSLDLNNLEFHEVGPKLNLGLDILDASLNVSLTIGSTPTGGLALFPESIGRANLPTQVIDVAEAFALAIINDVAYEDLLRRHQSILRRLKGPSLDNVLHFVWKILQEHDVSRERKKGGDWLVPFLQLQAAVFRCTMDNRLLTSTMLLHLISTENLFSRSRIEEMENSANGASRPRLSYDVESLWLLLSHMEWYFELVRATIFRSILSDEQESSYLCSAQTTTLDFLLSHPVTLELLQALCKEIRRFALFVCRNSMPSAPYPGSSETALLLDAVSTSQLQSILRDRVEKFGVRLNAWEQVLHQLSFMQQARQNDDEAELISAQLSPARHSAIADTIAVISKNAQLVTSQLHLFETGYQTPDLLAGRDILSKDPLNGHEIPGQLYRQCSLCHGVASLWNYPAVRAYGAESSAAHWMSQWAARCICGGSWV
ncbi:hypothetical protein QFC19_002606 [Naganishia cerealis]|uniref:Uncharacterized protein n=1 Tax=Naganishia cerealis TaxID=610337 RepID=A0ACC2WA85_9TREE|nr:hypothetical protein QFC19_002606 [Naganishia cerealis]